MFQMRHSTAALFALGLLTVGIFGGYLVLRNRFPEPAPIERRGPERG